jgi:hypothetical protein
MSMRRSLHGFYFIDNKHWLKFAFEAAERMNKRVATVKTKDFSADNIHDAISRKIFLVFFQKTSAQSHSPTTSASMRVLE